MTAFLLLLAGGSPVGGGPGPAPVSPTTPAGAVNTEPFNALTYNAAR